MSTHQCIVCGLDQQEFRMIENDDHWACRRHPQRAIDLAPSLVVGAKVTTTWGDKNAFIKEIVWSETGQRKRFIVEDGEGWMSTLWAEDITSVKS